ncbi:MAG: 30S ribosomal protein S3ae [Candidatus Thermoplasmatota archaeon]
MAEKTRTTTRKVKDKWRSKAWYNVMAPDMFNRAKIAESFTDDAEKLVGRVTEVTVQEMTGDFMKAHIKMRFKVRTIIGSEAYTDFVGHVLTSDYIRRLTRRKRTKTDLAVDVELKDGFVVRVKPMAITEQRIQSSQQTAIRNIMRSALLEMGRTSTLDEFVKKMISGEMSRDMAKAAKSIHPIQRVEIRRSEVITMGILPEIKPLPGERPEEAPPQAPEEQRPVEAEVSGSSDPDIEQS